MQSDHEECDGGNECEECKKLPSKQEVGVRLYAGDVLAKGNMRLQITDGGDVQLLNNGNRVWNTNTSGTNAYIYMQADGNLVAYASGDSAWSSATRNGDALVLDGSKLAIMLGNRTIKQLYPVVPETDHLDVDQRLYAGTRVVAGNTTLSILGDGNLTIKKTAVECGRPRLQATPGHLQSCRATATSLCGVKTAPPCFPPTPATPRPSS